MSTQNLSSRHLEQAQKNAARLEKLVSKNQKEIVDTRESLERLIGEGKTLAKELAEAKEYLADLEEAQHDG